MKDKMYATTESEILFQIDPKTLDTLNKVDLSKSFQVTTAYISALLAFPSSHAIVFCHSLPSHSSLRRFSCLRDKA